MIFSARRWNRLGYPVLRLSLRGAESSRAVSRSTYHAGMFEDIADVMAAVKAGPGRRASFLSAIPWVATSCVGFCAPDAGCTMRAAVVVSAPIDLKATSQRFMEPRNVLYHNWLLNRMKQDALDIAVSEEERAAINEARTVYGVRRSLRCPPVRLRGRGDLTDRCAGLRYLADIPVPTLIIHAQDDPWIPFEPYARFAWSDNPNITPLLPAQRRPCGLSPGE